jgi:hypothetical protein
MNRALYITEEPTSRDISFQEPSQDRHRYDWEAAYFRITLLCYQCIQLPMINAESQSPQAGQLPHHQDGSGIREGALLEMMNPLARFLAMYFFAAFSPSAGCL